MSERATKQMLEIRLNLIYYILNAELRQVDLYGLARKGSWLAVGFDKQLVQPAKLFQLTVTACKGSWLAVGF